MKTTHLKVPPTSDLAASVHLEKAFGAIPGVHGIHLDLANGHITVEHDDVPPEHFQRAVFTAGLTAEIVADK